ncbi:universal stress protein [Benzoatithermus flavus]|uniref:Universal stress protein n=1 Tax=Benzoatithermus flavus TaxID=3108223 RepID=A0ABU8XT47_9PROT
MTSPDPTDVQDFSHIVHPTDFTAGGEAAFAHALRLALATHGHFYLVHAEKLEIGEDADWAAFPGVRSTLTRWGLLAPDAAPTAVSEKLGLRVTKADVPDEDPTDAILRFTTENRCDLLVLATHAREGLARFLQGSIAESLARRAKIPTLFLPVGHPGFVDAATGKASLRNILLPIDLSTSSGYAASLAFRIADALDCGDTLLHALHVGTPEEMPTAAVDARHESRLRRILADGSVVPRILQTAAEIDADLIVMPTRGRDGLLDALRGSTTEQVLRQAGRPLLAVPVR